MATEEYLKVTAISSAKTIGFATIKATPKKITKVLNDPRNIVVNSITETENGCAVNISFTYNGENIIDGKTTAILGYSYLNTFTEVISETKSDDRIENGENTITVNIPNFHPILNETYYFGLSLINTADNILGSGRYVVRFTYFESGTDTEYLARYIYVSNAGENLRNEYEAECDYDLWVSPTTGKYYTYPSEAVHEHIYVTFKTEDEEQNQAYFYVTAKTGYFIKNSDAVALPVNIDADKLELNPETNYWRYK